jgi:autotransporter-associated beta strand protein/T5SS/PEP-CTERM-associated repeat protein
MKRMIICAVAVLGLALASGATDYIWQGGDGAFSDPAKWSPAGVPGNGDTAKFSSAADGTVTFAAPVNNSSLVASALNGNTLTLDLAGNAYTLTNRFYFEGTQPNSYLTVSNGFFTVPTNICDVKINQGVAPARLTFAHGATASLNSLYTWRSELNVEDGASLACDNEVKIGNDTPNSDSFLNVNGGSLTLNHNLWINGGNSSTSTLNVTGGSVVAKKYFSIGNGGGGTGWGVFNLSGGVLDTHYDVWLGNASSARAVANISGGLWVSRSAFEVAHGGGATSWLNMSGGEIWLASNKHFIVAHSGNGHMTTGTVSLTGGQITVTNSGSVFQIANASNGLGRVFVGGSGTLLARDIRVGNSRGARGECVVSGGWVRVVSALNVGAVAGADSAMRVDGGEVNANSVRVGDPAGSEGFLVLSNGQMWTEGKFYVGYAGTGTLHVAGGLLASSNDVAIGSGYPGYGAVLMTGGGILCSNSVKIGDWGGSGAFDMRGGSIWSANSVIIANGNGSTGTLVMTGGRIVTPQNVTIANNPLKGAWGTLVMSGGEIIASNSLTLANGAWTNWGKALVTGGSIEANTMTVGGNGWGEWVQSNGTVTVRSNLIAGNGASGTGTVALAGGELTVRTNLTAGVSGFGSLRVSGGTLTVSNSLNCADVLNSRGSLALAGGRVAAKGGTWGNKGLAQVEISGGTNAFSGTVTVGNYTQAVLQITGGSNSFPNLYVARNNAGSSASVTVSGGQTTVADYLDVGQAGPAVLEVAGGELTTKYLRLNPGTPVSPVPPQSEIRVTGGRLQVNNDCYMPDTASITGRLTLAGGVFAVPAVRQHHGKLHVLFDGGTVEALRSDSTFIRALDRLALTGNGLVADSAGFAIGTSLALPDADGEHGRLVKKGAGVFTLNADNSFTGPVVVEGGELALGAGGLITLAGGCEVDGGALLNLSARALDFTLPAGTVSRIDGELRLASGKTLTVASGATLSGTGTVGRVALESGATFARAAAAGGALMNVGVLVIPAGATINLTGYTAEELWPGIQIVSGGTLSVAQGGSVNVTLDGAASQAPVALRVSNGALTAFSYNPGTLIKLQ